MKKLTAAEPKLTHDIVDLSRAKALHATLATRADNRTMPVLGDDLGKGWTLCYHWDTGFTEDLGADGSSKVSYLAHRTSKSIDLTSQIVGLQRPASLHTTYVGFWNIHLSLKSRDRNRRQYR